MAGKLYFLLFVAILVMVLASPGLCATNFFLNADFQGGDSNSDGIPDDWGWWHSGMDGGGAAHISTVTEGGGNIYVDIGTDSSAGGYSLVYQVYPAGAGETWKIAADIKDTYANNGNFAALKIYTRDSGGDIITTWEEIQGGVTGSWQRFEMAKTLPAGTVSINGELVITRWDGLDRCSYGFDNAFLGLASLLNADIPSPDDGEALVELDVVLSWGVPTGVSSPTYNVYFGANPGNLELVASALSGTNFTPGRLAEGVEYSWRIDVNDPGASTTYTGETWSFTTMTFPGGCPDGDMNLDCQLTVADLLIFIKQWMDVPGCVGYLSYECADLLGGDGVNAEDFSVVSSEWQEQGSAVVISEILASNGNVLDDEDGDSPDWIEIFNGSKAAVTLDGWKLRDSNFDWQFPDGVTLASEEFLVVFASGKDRRVAGKELHTNFELEKDGEYLGLVKPDSSIAHEYFPSYGKQRRNISSGLYDGIERYFAAPTPGWSNSDVNYAGMVEDTKFTHDRGFYEAPFNLSITSNTPGAVIRYTLDGREPTESSAQYTSSIYISSTPKATSLRARAFKVDWMPTDTDTHTYIFYTSTVIKSLPVISIVGDEEESLFEPNGIMAIVGGHYNGGWWVADGPGDYNNPMQRGMAYERPISFEFIEPADNSGFQIDCGIRVQGSDFHRPHYTRGDNWHGWTYNKFSFKFFFRNEYSGTNELEYPMIPINPYDHFDALTIRGGHNDTSNPFIIDELVRRLHYDMGAVASLGTLANLFINGEYKAYYNPCERLDEKFFQKWHDSDHDWDVITQRTARNGDYVAWYALLDYARNNDLSVLGNYVEVGNRMDITAFVDYLILQIYSSNWDWPMNNWTAARERSPEGKFTFHIWDAEGAFVNLYLSAFDDYPGWWAGGLNIHNGPNCELYRALKANSDFRQLFSDRVYKHFYGIGSLTNAHITERFNELYDQMLGVLPSMSTYIRDTFVPNRRSWIISDYKSENVFTFPGPDLYINGQIKYGGGYITSGDTLTMVNAIGVGTIYYTLTGSDPRLSGGAINVADGAVAYTGGITLTKSSYIKARTYNAGEWSGLNEAGFSTTDVGESIRITEIMYHPADPPVGDPNAEFVEIKNIGAGAIDLDWLRFTKGVDYDFSGNGQVVSNSVLIDHNSSWKYEQSGVNLGTAWRAKTYVDSGWPGGNSVLYVENASPWPPAPWTKGQALTLGRPTYYFRTHFTLTADPATEQISLFAKVLVDDGAVFYINGTEVYTLAMNSSNPAYTDYANRTQGNAFEETFILPTSSLVQGDNVMAVEVHQASAGSSDIVFGMRLDATVTETFTKNPGQLAAGDYALVVKNQDAFESVYGTGATGKILGEYSGSLRNSGEKIRLKDAAGGNIHDFKFKDGWYYVTDGGGFSLTIVDASNPDPNSWGDKDGWRASTFVGGTPGAGDTGPVPGDIVVNEVLAHSDIYPNDWVELHNTTAFPINIGGWFLSDNNNDDPNLMKYEISSGTTIAAGGYIVFTQDDHFGNISIPGCIAPFALSENGETVYLSSGLAGELTGFREQEDFGASEVGIAFGRHYKASTDTFNFVAMSSNTPGFANAYPKVGPIVINEIMYNPPSGGSYDNDEYEYIELLNISGSSVTLYDAAKVEAWKFTDGIDYTFPSGVSSITMSPGEYLLVVKNLTAFASRYGGLGVTIVGPYSGYLSNGGEKLEIGKPGDVDGFGLRQYIRQDRVNYDDIAPWATTPDGGGSSLSRITAGNYGNDVGNWQGSLSSPGAINP